jgi:uncharacterized protein
LGVYEDKKKSTLEFFKAAELGSIIGIFNYSEALFHGSGIKQNKKEAKIWMKKAADQNHPHSQYKMGYICQYGIDTEEDDKDYKEAMEWYFKSAHQNWSQAQIHLGFLYSTGTIVEKDLKESRKWKELAHITEGGKKYDSDNDSD